MNFYIVWKKFSSLFDTLIGFQQLEKEKWGKREREKYTYIQ